MIFEVNSVMLNLLGPKIGCSVHPSFWLREACWASRALLHHRVFWAKCYMVRISVCLEPLFNHLLWPGYRKSANPVGNTRCSSENLHEGRKFLKLPEMDPKGFFTISESSRRLDVTCKFHVVSMPTWSLWQQGATVLLGNVNVELRYHRLTAVY